MSTNSQRFMCLLEELETSHKLIKAGFGNLQEIDVANDFYHLPHQLMASGLERLFKCYIALIHEDQTGSFPDMKFMKDLGHDLVNLHKEFCSKYYGGVTRPLVKQELVFVTTDTTLQECIRILSLFGKFGRYYNLDVVAGSPNGPIDPKSEWERLERTIEDWTPYISDTEALHNDYFPRVHAKLVAKLERMVRAIAFQFTIGDHPDQFGHLRQTSGIFSDFRNLRDEQLGTVDYRQSVRILKREQKNWIKRNETDILNGEWPTRSIARNEFAGEWPFRVDHVIVELQDRLFAVVNMEGYAFALNGTAASHLKLPFPHDAGMAILGKSVGPFTEMALAMREPTS